MHKQQVKAFLKELQNNESLKKELESLLNKTAFASEQEADKAIEQIIDFAADHDYNFSGKEYKSVIDDVQEELSDDELDSISGGHGHIKIALIGLDIGW
jgi:predicted ribosomally synthesized peptide with nif11-like leader